MILSEKQTHGLGTLSTDGCSHQRADLRLSGLPVAGGACGGGDGFFTRSCVGFREAGLEREEPSAAVVCMVTLRGASGWRRTSSKGFTGVSLQACILLMWQPAIKDEMRGTATPQLRDTSS